MQGARRNKGSGPQKQTLRLAENKHNGAQKQKQRLAEANASGKVGPPGLR
jgi:hypothetical protein